MFGARPFGNLPFTGTQVQQELLSMLAGTGAFILTGKASTKAMTMPAAVGAFSYTLYPATRGALLFAETGSFVVSGTNTSYTYRGHPFGSVGFGRYVLDPQAVIVPINATLTKNQGSRPIEHRRTSAAELLKTRTADPSLLALRSTPPRLLRSRQAEPSLGD